MIHPISTQASIKNKLPEKLRPALDYIHENLDQVPSIEEMSQLCKLSPSYFSRTFRKTMDESFVGYVNRVKIERAVEMLKSDNKSVNFIAAKLGYTDASYFIKVFKRYTGTTPLAYRRRGPHSAVGQRMAI